MRRYTVYLLVLIGLALGVLAAESLTLMLGLVALAACGIVLLSDYEISLYTVGAYSIVDYILRTYAGGFASLWDELYLAVLILLCGYKWVICGKKAKYKHTPLDIPIMLFISVMFFVLIVNSPDISISIEGFRAVVQYILWYFVVVQLLKTENGARNLCIVFALVCGGIALHGIYQYIIGAEMPAGWVDSNEAGVRTRVYSILGSPNVMGSLMTLSAPIMLSLGITAKNTKQRVVFWGLFISTLLSLVFTFSRGAWIGFAAAAAVYVFLKDKRLFIPVIIGALLVLVFVPSVGNRITYMLSPEYIESSLRGGRLIRWIQGLELWGNYFWTGVGHGHFGGAVAMNHELKAIIGTDIIPTYYMDNYYLKTAVETGIIGLSAFLALMYSFIICSVRTIKYTVSRNTRELQIGIFSGCVGIIVHNCVENIFEVPMMTSCFWLLAAVMMHYWYLNFVKKGTL